MRTKEMTWSEESSRPNDDEYCACCDAYVAPSSRHVVEVTACMSDAKHPSIWETTQHDSGGAFTVGPGCAKKYLKGFTTPRN